jgi:hypothetical protein
MSSVSKSRPSYRPNVETLESRMQPGSILTGGLGLSLLGSALDLSSLLSDSNPSQSHSLNHLPAINQTGANWASSQMSTAPSHGSTVGTSQTATPVVTSSTASSNLANQMVAVNAASQHGVGVSSTPSHAVGSSNTNGNSTSAKDNSNVAFNAVPATIVATNTALQTLSTTSVHPAVNFVGRGYSADNGGIQPFDTLNWISYFGNAGSKLNKVAVTPDGSGVIVAGTVQDPVDPTINDAVVAELSSDGSTLIGAATIGLPVSGSQSSANGLAVDSTGNIYASGTASVGGSTIAVAAKVDFASPTGYDWLMSLGFAGAGGAGDVANGCKLDAAGANLFVSGGGDATPNGGAPGALEISKLSTVDGSGTTYSYNYTSGGNPVTVTGNDVAVASTGNVDVAAQLTFNTGLSSDVFGTTALPAGPTLFTFGNQINNVNSSMTGISVDSANNMVMTGTMNYVGETTLRTIIGFSDSGIVNAHAYYWGVTFGGVLGNWVGNGLALNPDATPVASGTLDDNSGGFGIHSTVLVHFFADGSGITDNTNFGNPTPFGANDDYGTGVAIGSNLFGSVYYQDGWTNSTDFNVTAGVYQSTYGGDPSTGWVGQIGLS